MTNKYKNGSWKTISKHQDSSSQSLFSSFVDRLYMGYDHNQHTGNITIRISIKNSGSPLIFTFIMNRQGQLINEDN